MPSIFNTIFNATGSYTISDLDSSISCTVNGITIWDESVVGKQVTGEANITVTIPSVVNNISILMDIPNLPKNTAAAGWGAYPEPTLGDKYFPMGVIVGVAGDKVIVNVTKNANAWNDGTYQLAIGYKYLIA